MYLITVFFFSFCIHLQLTLLHLLRGIGMGERSDDPTPTPFWGQIFIYFIYEVLGKRSVQKEPFFLNPIEKFLPTPLLLL